MHYSNDTMVRFKFKILLMGAAGVGKTSLLHRFVDDMFNDDYAATIGAQFLTKNVNLGLKDLEDDEVKLIIWDLAGQKRYYDLRTTFYRGAHGALLIFDLTRHETFKEVEDWYLEMSPVLGKEFPLLLIGNKSDLVDELGVSIDITEINKYAEDKGSYYIETSAKTGKNVEKAFWELARDVAAKEAGLKIPKKVIKKKIKIAAKEKGGASYIVKSKVRQYIKSNGCKTSSEILDGNVLNRIIGEILDNAIAKARANGRNTVLPVDI